MELFAAIGWLLRIYVGVFGPLGLLALIVATLVAAGFVIFAVRQVTGLLARLLGIREFHLSEWKVTHPASWRWLRATGAVVSFVTSARLLAGNPSIGLPLVGVTCSGGWLAVRVAQFWSGYPFSWAGFIAACRTAVTKQALDLVWQSIGVVSVQRGKLRLPRYESWSLARTTDGWEYGLHCNGFVPPQGTGGLAQIMEACASPGSEYDTITSNLNNILLEPGELRGPLVALLRYTNQLPLYAGTAVDRPEGYPQGVGRLTLMHRLPLERVRSYPWRPGYWAERIRARAAELADDDNPRGKAVAEIIAAGAPVGFDADGRIVRADCDDEHTCLMGQTRTGKSTLLECLLHFLVEMPTDLVRLAVIDMKGGAHLNGYRARASAYATNGTEAVALLEAITAQVVTPRWDLLRSTDRQKITEPTPDEPYWYVVVDEGGKLPPEAMDLLATMSMEGAAGHCIVIFSTQYMRTEDGFPRPLDVNLPNRMATRLPDQTASAKAMTRGGMNASCRPDLIRRSKRTRGVFCHSAGGADPAYAKSMLTGGIRDQRRRVRAALRAWGPPPPLLVVGPVAEPEPEAEELPVAEPEQWGDERLAAMQARLTELCGYIAGRPAAPDAGRITRARLAQVINLARRQHNPARMAAGPDRDGVQATRAEIERLARDLNTDLQDRDSVAAEREPAVVVG